MAIKTPDQHKSGLADKQALQNDIAELNRRMGFVPDPTVTPEKVQAMMLADGIRPEENAFSREMIRLRHEDATP